MNDQHAAATAGPSEDERAVQDWVLERLAAHLEVPVEQLPEDAVFTEVGLSSIRAVELVTEIEEQYDLELSPVLLYDHPSVPEVARRVTEARRGAAAGADG